MVWLQRNVAPTQCVVLSKVLFWGSDKLDAEAERDGKREASLCAPRLSRRDASAL